MTRYHAEEFVRYLRGRKVAPNGRSSSTGTSRHGYQVHTGNLLQPVQLRKSPATSAALFGKSVSDHRDQSIPVEDLKPIVVLSSEQEQLFFNAFDDRQLPLFATLLLPGLRPGELTHLLLPDDLNLEEGWMHVRNKPGLESQDSQ